MSVFGAQDIQTRRYARATPDIFTYIDPGNIRLTVGINVISVSVAPIPCFSVIVQADLANGGTVETGGPMLVFGNGTQLTAGAAMGFYVSQENGEDIIRTAMGIGVERLTGYAAAPYQMPGPGKVRAIRLSSIRLVASAAGQIARVQFMPFTV